MEKRATKVSSRRIFSRVILFTPIMSNYEQGVSESALDYLLLQPIKDQHIQDISWCPFWIAKLISAEAHQRGEGQHKKWWPPYLMPFGLPNCPRLNWMKDDFLRQDCGMDREYETFPLNKWFFCSSFNYVRRLQWPILTWLPLLSPPSWMEREESCCWWQRRTT